MDLNTPSGRGAGAHTRLPLLDVFPWSRGVGTDADTHLWQDNAAMASGKERKKRSCFGANLESGPIRESWVDVTGVDRRDDSPYDLNMTYVERHVTVRERVNPKPAPPSLVVNFFFDKTLR